VTLSPEDSKASELVKASDDARRASKKKLTRRMVTAALVLLFVGFLNPIVEFAANALSIVTDWQSMTNVAAPTTAPSLDDVAATQTNGPLPNDGSVSAVCFTAAGQPTDCQTTGSGVVVQLEACTPQGVRQAWGINEHAQLLIATARTDAGCLVTPSDVAQAGEANALDLKSAKQNSTRPPAVLLECARRGGSPSVPCSTPHEIEFVGAPAAPTEPDADQTCQAMARSYTANDLSDVGGLLSRPYRSPKGEIRCAVETVSTVLDGTVLGIGNGELPRV